MNYLYFYVEQCLITLGALGTMAGTERRRPVAHPTMLPGRVCLCRGGEQGQVLLRLRRHRIRSTRASRRGRV